MKHIYTSILTMLLAFSSVSLMGQCFDGGHSAFANQGWLSCETSVGPIPERGDNHWIMYDLGYDYTVESLYLWNYNEWGSTGYGVQEILIDYSSDQENWTTIGPFTIDQAPGSWKYLGDEGPNLGSAVGRYFLITVMDTWDGQGECAGISEIRFNLGDPVDVEDITDVEWNIAPNPAQDRIEVTLPTESSVQTVEIYNNIGMKVMGLNTYLQSKLIIPIETLQTGMYLVTIRSEEGVWSKPFIKVD